MDVYLPDTEEFQKDITLLADLISYSAQRKTKLPEDYRRTFQLIRLADYLGVDPFLKMCAEQLDVRVPQLWNLNAIRRCGGWLGGATVPTSPTSTQQIGCVAQYVGAVSRVQPH